MKVSPLEDWYSVHKVTEYYPNGQVKDSVEINKHVEGQKWWEQDHFFQNGEQYLVSSLSTKVTKKDYSWYSCSSINIHSNSKIDD